MRMTSSKNKGKKGYHFTILEETAVKTHGKRERREGCARERELLGELGVQEKAGGRAAAGHVQGKAAHCWRCALRWLRTRRADRLAE